MEAEREIEIINLAPATERTLAAAGVAMIAGGSALVAYFDPSASNFFPVCPLYSLTGFACPGCGLTRGFHALFHGDIVTSLDFNALIPVWCAIFGWVFISLLLVAIRGKGLPMWPTNPRFVWIFMIALLVFGVLR